MSTPASSIACRCFLLLALFCGSTFALQAEPLPARSSTEADLDDPVLPLQPKSKRTEADEDRLQALALFAEGRTLEQRNETAEALRKYERAFRYDAEGVSILRELIPLAFNLNRDSEAVRYASKFATFESGDPNMLRRLGVVLTEQGEWKQALALYEKVAKAEPADDKSSAGVLLRMEMGRLYFLDEQTKKAGEQFVQVLKALQNPKDYGLNERLEKAIRGEKGEGLELIFTVLMESEHWNEAGAALEKLTPLLNDEAVASYLRASLAAKRGDTEKALTELDKYFAAREVSRDYAPYELLREILTVAKRDGEILDRLLKQVAEQPGNTPLSYALAEEYRREKKYDLAIPRYEAALDKQATRESFRGLVTCLRETGDRKKLLKILGQIVAKTSTLDAVKVGDEDEPKSKKDKSDKKTPPKKKPAEPETEYGPAAESKALSALALELYDGSELEHAAPLRAAALLAVDAREWKLADELFERAIKAKPADKAEVLLTWGIKLLVGEQKEGAVKIFQRGVDERVLPDSNPAFSFYLAGALALAEKHDDALAAAKTAAEKQPNNPRFASRVPWVLNVSKRHADAEAGYRALIKKYDDTYDKDDLREVLRDARLSLSNLAVIKHDLPQAEEWLEQVLDEFPDDIGAKNDLGYLWADQNKRLARSLRMIETAIAAEPDNQAYLDSYGWILYRLGRYQEALAAQLQAVEPRGSREIDGVVLDHLADIYSALKQHKEALEVRRGAVTALEKSDEQGKIKEVRAKLAADEKSQQ
jgi:tetratricopeptide (TPR) repeat protein